MWQGFITWFYVFIGALVLCTIADIVFGFTVVGKWIKEGICNRLSLCKQAMDDKVEEDDYERCVECGGKTSYKRTTPIEQRQFYVTGIGQYCWRCFTNAHGGKLPF